MGKAKRQGNDGAADSGRPFSPVLLFVSPHLHRCNMYVNRNSGEGCAWRIEARNMAKGRGVWDGVRLGTALGHYLFGSLLYSRREKVKKKKIWIKLMMRLSLCGCDLSNMSFSYGLFVGTKCHALAITATLVSKVFTELEEYTYQERKLWRRNNSAEFSLSLDHRWFLSLKRNSYQSSTEPG